MASVEAKTNGAKNAFDEALSSQPVVVTDKAGDDYRVNIPTFEGPLDLLLHLIRKEQINIYDIPIAKICQSYLEHIQLMQAPDVNLAGEFMVMAATLTVMKSFILLPREEGDMEADDPRLPLVAQLLELERFKKAANELDSMPWLNRDIYARPLSALQDVMPEWKRSSPHRLRSIDLFQLLVCLKVSLSRTQRPPLQISTDPIAIKDKVGQIGMFLETTNNQIFDFAMLLPPAARARDIVISFLAMLELAKLKFIEIIQHENFGPIQIRGVRPLTELNVTLLDQF